MPNEYYAHVAFLGIVVQTSSAVLLAALFAALQRLACERADPRPWLRDWSRSFVGLAVALLALFARYLLANGLSPLPDGDFQNADAPLTRALYFVYQAGKFAFFAFLFAGCARLADPASRWARLSRLPLAVALLAGAAFCAIVGSGLNEIVAWQTPVAIALSAAAAAILVLAPKERRSLGTRLVVLVCTLFALLWAIYWWSFSHRDAPVPFGQEFLVTLARYNSFIDVLMQSMLGLAMVVTVFQDLEREAEATRAERAALQARLVESRNLERLGAVVSGVAHELNNPLTAILGYSEELLDPRDAGGVPGGAGSQDGLRVIHEQAQRCRAIVRDLLGFARPRRPLREAVAPAALVERVVAGFTPTLRRAGVNVAVTVARDLPTLHADLIGLEQVLANLIDNAIDASPPGASITVSASQRGEACELVVEDAGPGVPAEFAERIFEPFFTTKEAGRGTGLGLAVSHRIVTAHGGTIRAEPRADGRSGARFVVLLPANAQTGDGAAASARALPVAAHGTAPSESARAVGGAPRLLLIDDESTVRAFLKHRFEQHGFEVVEVRGGAEALEAVRRAREPFDVAVTDVRMHGISGLALYEELVRTAPRLAQRVVAITGDLLAPEVERFATTSRCPVFEKPLDMERLVACVAALAGRELTRPVAESA